MRLLSLVTLVFVLGCDGPRDVARDASMDAAPDSGADTGLDVGSDTGFDTQADATMPSGLAGRWLESVAGLNAEFCRCEIAVRDYDTAEECALAEGSTAGVRACANEAIAAFPELNEGFACVTAAFETQAICFASKSCDVGGLNECEATANPIIAACPPSPLEALDGFFAAVGACVRADAGACPDIPTATGFGVIATGNTIGAGNDFAPSCAVGSDVGADVAIAWTAPATGTFRFDTFGSSFDTQLAAFASCEGAELGCSDDAGDRRTSQIELSLTEGQTVILVVDGFDELSAGDFVINVAM